MNRQLLHHRQIEELPRRVQDVLDQWGRYAMIDDVEKALIQTGCPKKSAAIRAFARGSSSSIPCKLTIGSMFWAPETVRRPHVGERRAA
jgi:hypothetical protein